MGKFAVIVQAGPQDGARALHGLLYADELHEAGHEVRVVFDGAGTTWVKTYSAPDHKYHDLFEKVRSAGLIGGVCEYCAAAFNVKAAVVQGGLPLQGDAGGHPSISRLVADGYALLVL